MSSTRNALTVPKNAWDHIVTRGFVEFSIDPDFLQSTVPSIIEGMVRMTTNPHHIDEFKVKILGTDEAGWPQDSGLVKRSDDEKKWFFHYCGDTTYTHLERSGAPVYYYDTFFSALEKVNKQARLFALQFARQYDEVRAGTTPKLAPRVKNAYCLTRVLRYLKRDEVEKNDANIHLDLSFMTVHWISTQPGLVLFGPDGNQYRTQETAYDSVALFPGKKCAAVMRGEHGLGTYGTFHGVKNPLRHVAKEDRFALVSFVHIPLSDEEAMWLQAADVAMKRAKQPLIICV